MSFSLKAEWWSGSRFVNGNTSRVINLDQVDAQTLADTLRALARNVERAAGLRRLPCAATDEERFTAIAKKCLAETGPDRFILAIKLFRERTGLGLKDSKDWIDKARAS